ncbi:MAG TPA: 2Fe-2S iron-sulfur cluster-binding protein [Anaerolineales bacterium]|nr:2Fe-2S iron-sulfur cluster-binding protein [Anaerolineales bacterium]
MYTKKGYVAEMILWDGLRHARIECPANLIPAAGQYLLASDTSGLTLPVPIFYTESAPQGFIAAPPVPDSWNPGQEVYLRGPLGRGFVLPSSARKVALVAFDASPARLYGLITSALTQKAAVVLLSDSILDNLPDAVEAQPVSSLSEIMVWADYIAFDVARENLSGLNERVFNGDPTKALSEAQVLIRTPLACGGMAECGVCAVMVKFGWKMSCKDGPVFNSNDFPSPIGREQGDG